MPRTRQGEAVKKSMEKQYGRKEGQTRYYKAEHSHPEWTKGRKGTKK